MAVGKRPAAHGLLAARLKAARKGKSLPTRTGSAGDIVGASGAGPSRLGNHSDSGDEEEVLEVPSNRTCAAVQSFLLYLL